MQSSITIMLRVLRQIEQAKQANQTFGTILTLQQTLDLLSSVARMRVTRHAWRILGVQS